jgi:hypothetical protein
MVAPTRRRVSSSILLLLLLYIRCVVFFWPKRQHSLYRLSSIARLASYSEAEREYIKEFSTALRKKGWIGVWEGFSKGF